MLWAVAIVLLTVLTCSGIALAITKACSKVGKLRERERLLSGGGARSAAQLQGGVPRGRPGIDESVVAARFTTSLSSVAHPTLDKAECAPGRYVGTLCLDPKGPHVQRYINTHTP